MVDASLADRLRASPARLWAADRWWSVAEVVANTTPRPAPSSPALISSDCPLTMVQDLIAADGALSDLVLLPARLPEAQRQALLATRQLTPPGQPPGATRWHLATSGTTAQPRLIPHTLAELARGLRPALRPPRRWGLVYDAARFAGLQVLCQALLAGEEVVALPPGTDQAASAAALGVDALSATPSWWRRQALLGFPQPWPLRQITLGGEIADQALLDHLRASFPQARIHHVYASTEGGVGFAVGDGLAGFPAAVIQRGVAGLALRIADDGHLWLRPPGGHWLDSGDVVEQRNDRIHFLGRASGVINVGGHKVHPEAVEAILCAHPLVAAARVSAKASPILGQVVQAEVLLQPNTDPSWRDSLRRHCHQHLAPPQVPAIITLMDAVELGPTGKIGRLASAQLTDHRHE